jgi:hypothetical protein
MGKLVDTVKRWFEWMPGWMPVCAAIFGAALWVGQYTQSINDRLNSLEKQMQAIQEYLRNQHSKNSYEPESRNRQQDNSQTSSDAY